MRYLLLSAAASILLGAPAMAQDAAAPAGATPLAIKTGKMMHSSDGTAIGYIEDVQKSGGQPADVSVIYEQRFVHIPASTISAGPKGLVTSLSRKDIDQLR